MSHPDPRALREQLLLSDPVDTESTGFLRFVVRLSEALNIDLPRREHPKHSTLAGCYDFLAKARPVARPELDPEHAVGTH